MSTPFTLPFTRFRTWVLSILSGAALYLTGNQCARASEAVIHFQVGDIKEDQLVTISLFDQDAPATVENFRKLAARKFYKGIVVHRVVPETIIQMGDPLSRGKDRSQTGTGGPGYTLPAESNKHRNIAGAVVMAALPETINPSHASNGSQFYIALRALPELDKDATVFGQVTSGLEFLVSVSRRGRDTNDYPLERVTIRSIDFK